MRDIIIENTNITDWKKLYNFIIHSDYQLSYKVDGEFVSIPDDIDQMFTKTNLPQSFNFQIENVIFSIISLFSEGERKDFFYKV
jgi:hypothetical protein